MKKTLLILTCLFCILTLFSCGSMPEQTTENITTKSTESITEEITEKVSYETTDKTSVSESAENTTITDTSETETITTSITETTEIYITETTEAPTTTESTLESTCGETEVLTTESTKEASAETTESLITETTEELTTENTTTKEETTEEETTEEDGSARVVIESSQTTLKPGDEFAIIISIENNPGIFSFTFSLPIDNTVFDFVGADTTGSLCASKGICQYDESTSSYKFNGYSSSPFQNITNDGKLVTITLKVKNNVRADKYDLSINLDRKNIINVDAHVVEFKSATIVLNVSK